MDMRTKKLQERDRLLEKASAILDTATARKRGLTDDEKERHDGLLAQAREINDLLQRNAAYEAEAAVTVPISQTTAMAVAHGTMPASAGGGLAQGAHHAQPQQPYGGASFAAYFASQGRETFTGGGALIPQAVFNPWASLAPAPVAIAAGVRVVPIADGTIIPSVSSRPAAAWMGENSQIPATSVGLKGHKTWFRKVAARVVEENDLVRSAGPESTRLWLDEITRALNLTVDHGIFEGTGTEHALLGLKYRSGILGAALGADGAEIADLDAFIEALTALEAANARPSGWVMAPRTWGDLMKLRDQTDSLRPLLGEAYGVAGTTGVSRRLLGLTVHLSSQLSVTEEEGSSGAVCSSVYLAEWGQVLLLRDEKQAVYLDVDSGETFSKDQAQIRGLMRVDLATPNQEAIYRLRGIKPTT